MVHVSIESGELFTTTALMGDADRVLVTEPENIVYEWTQGV